MNNYREKQIPAIRYINVKVKVSRVELTKSKRKRERDSVFDEEKKDIQIFFSISKIGREWDLVHDRELQQRDEGRGGERAQWAAAS